jgi:hypothetical protein
VREVLSIVEVLRRPLFDRDFTERFANTFAAHALDLTRRNLHRAATILVGRLWDNDSGSQSIPPLWRFLSSDDGRAELVRRRRTSAIELTRSPPGYAALTDDAEQADKAEQEALQELQQLRCLIDDPVAAKTRQSLLALRDRIAHAVESSRREQHAMRSGLAIETAKWGDLDRVARHSAMVAAGLANLSQDLPIAYDDHQANWLEYANHFWAPFTQPD